MTSIPQNHRSEWLEADGLGGFASGTVGGVRTRRYHALLLAATRPPGDRMVLVNGLDVAIEMTSGRYALSTQHYAPGVDAPDGESRLVSFNAEPWPQWRYAVPGGEVLYELFVPRDQALVAQRWTWEGATDAQPRLEVRPFFSGRDFHGTHHENTAFQFAPTTQGTSQHWQFYPSIPEVVAHSNGIYHHEPGWYRNFLYAEEAARGLDAVEDLAVPGRYLFHLGKESAVLIFSTPGASAPALPTIPALDRWDQLASRERTRRAAFTTPHHRAADAYLVRRGEGRSIIAGYPWFGDWGRDTFISMRGLCLATGRLEEARQILVAWADTVSEGMLPNRFADQGDAPEYNSVDASLWYVVVVHEFLAAARDDAQLSAQKDLLLATVERILTGYARGTRYGIRRDDDGLLACGAPGVQLTWMDAKVGDDVITPRTGKPVEIQALWLNALGLTARLAPTWQATFELGCESFRARFWNDERGCLYDVIDVDHQSGKMDGSVRPNQIFAVGGLPLALFEGDRAAEIVQVVHDQLWTPMGLRSLAPGEPGYAARYEGGPGERDRVYHQGTVWPWLTGAFVEAWLRVQRDTPEARREVRERFLAPELLRGDLAGLHHIPEIADAEAPHTARGCPFQAWSLGEIIRAENHCLHGLPKIGML